MLESGLSRLDKWWEMFSGYSSSRSGSNISDITIYYTLMNHIYPLMMTRCLLEDGQDHALIYTSSDLLHFFICAAFVFLHPYRLPWTSLNLFQEDLKLVISVPV